jgi:hypothetical protein
VLQAVRDPTSAEGLQPPAAPFGPCQVVVKSPHTYGVVFDLEWGAPKYLA